MADNEELENEVVESPATHKKKAQAWLFLLLGILVVVMIVDVVRKSFDDDDSKEEAAPTAAISTSPVNVRSFDEQIKDAKRAQAYQEGNEQRDAQRQTPAQIVQGIKEDQDNRRRNLSWSPTQKEKTIGEIFLEEEQMRAFKSRRSKMVVSLDNTRGIAQQPVTAGAYPRNQGLDKEQAFVESELARARKMQAQLMAGETPAMGGGAVPVVNNITAQNSTEYEVGQPASEQAGPSPGQVLLATGTVISAALDQMVMSDVTGSFRGIVTRDVYDPSQRFVLIPRGAKLVGKTIRLKGINEPIQNRMILTLNWCVLPNGKRISFNKTVAMDSAGVAALEDQVNYHLIPQILGVAAYALLSSETSRSGSGDSVDNTYEGDAGAAMREQFAPLAAKYLSLVPTVTLRPGEPMRVFIEDDLFITPWDRVYSGVLPGA